MDWEPIVVLIVVFVLVIPAALAVWLIVRSVSAGNRIGELSRRLGRLEAEVFRLKQEKEPARPASPAPQPKAVTPPVVLPPPTMVSQPAILPGLPTAVATPPISITPTPPPVTVPTAQTGRERIVAPPPEPGPKINWEQFMGVKGFAWIGGFTLFLGVVFAIQYAFAHHLISFELQAAFGFLAGLGLLVGGVMMSRKNFPALSQTLCATGVVILYAVTFACRSIYHFLTFSERGADALPAFAMMVLVTATGFCWLCGSMRSSLLSSGCLAAFSRRF